MTELIHTIIRVLDLDRSIAFNRDVLDLNPSHTWTSPTSHWSTCATRATTSRSSSR
jgi:catechol 2,3-dioxygenase-like lactoylglutathione lyase family enzyme